MNAVGADCSPELGHCTEFRTRCWCSREVSRGRAGSGRVSRQKRLVSCLVELSPPVLTRFAAHEFHPNWRVVGQCLAVRHSPCTFTPLMTMILSSSSCSSSPRADMTPDGRQYRRFHGTAAFLLAVRDSDRCCGEHKNHRTEPRCVTRMLELPSVANRKPR